MYLVFGVGRVNPPAVFAGLQQDVDGIKLQENLTGHAVKEGDVGQGGRSQEEYFTTGGALTQLWEQDIIEVRWWSLYSSYFTDRQKVLCFYIFCIWCKDTELSNSCPAGQRSSHSLISAVTMSCMLSRKLARCCVDVWWGEVIWATTAAASALAASTLLSSVKMSARHRIPSTCTSGSMQGRLGVI